MEDNQKASMKIKSPINLGRVILKGLGLFLIVNIVFSLTGLGNLGKYSLYNKIFPGRLRFPFGENPSESYNFSLDNIDAMIASHEIAGDLKGSDEFRIILIGDSSTWGILLRPEETISGIIDQKASPCKGKVIQAYNFGYPTLSLTKDLLFLDQAMNFQPDLIIWMVTLESFPEDKQFSSPIVSSNMDLIQRISDKYGILLPENEDGQKQSFFQKSLIGQRRNLADLIRLQLYGSMWAATHIDQSYPLDYERAQIDLENDQTYHDWIPPKVDGSKLAFRIIEDGMKIATDIPILLVNEPILISNGINNDIRYNFYYPRWVYDQYRQILTQRSLEQSWNYLDLWNIVPMSEFTNSAIHVTPVGEKIITEKILQWIHENSCS